MAGRTTRGIQLIREKSGRLLITVVLLAAGCANPSDRQAAVAESRASTLAGSTGKEPLAAQNEKHSEKSAEPVRLEAYQVKESAISDFGMSVTTNFEVQWGGKIEWMTVNAVASGSSADRAGLKPGDRIMAIDGQLVVGMDRDAMLGFFFQRRKGETSRLLVLGRQEALPRFVTLVASRPRP